MPESAPESDAAAEAVPDAQGAAAPAAATFTATDADFALGRAALAEVTDPTTVGVQLGSLDEGDGVTSVYFRADMLGYPGWRWTATIAHVEGSEPTVLETELTPGEGALLAPDWVPWIDRMADYRAAQDADGDDSDSGDDDGSDSDDSGDDDDESSDDSDDDDAPGIALLHSGDLDGVDIDSLDDDDDDDDDDDESDDDDSNDDDAAAAASPDEEPLTLER